MKKLLLVALTLLMLSPAAWAKSLRVVVAYPYIASIVQQIGKDRLKVDFLARGDYDPHTIVPKPSFIAKVRRADLLIINGAQLEIGWVPPLLKQANNPVVNPGNDGFLELTRYVDLIDVPTSVSRSQGDVHPDGNPHFYLDPYNIPPVARAIADRLAKLDPRNASYYRGNCGEFLAKFNAKMNEWNSRLQKCRGMEVIEYHKNFDYLLHRYNMRLVGTVEPLPGIPPTSKHINKLESIISTSKVKCILHDVYHPDDASRHLSQKHGIRLVVLPHDVGAVPEAVDIFKLYDEIVREAGEMTDIMLSAFIISVVLVGIHSFFGLEIIKRGIIFTDLAIGQMAALGAAVSIFFFDGAYLYPISLSFALLGGLAIALTAKRTDTLEAFIGLLYAFGIAGVYIILSKSSHGMETLHKLTASDILFTPVEDIWRTAIIYAALGLVLFFYTGGRPV